MIRYRNASETEKINKYKIQRKCKKKIKLYLLADVILIVYYFRYTEDIILEKPFLSCFLPSSNFKDLLKR